VSAGRADVEVKLARRNPASRDGCATYGPTAAPLSLLDFWYDLRGMLTRFGNHEDQHHQEVN
jgi:hypothetical protein